jgi:hypothetical protein
VGSARAHNNKDSPQEKTPEDAHKHTTSQGMQTYLLCTQAAVVYSGQGWLSAKSPQLCSRPARPPQGRHCDTGMHLIRCNGWQDASWSCDKSCLL